MPLIDGRETLVCRADEAHDTYQPKHKETRHLRRIDGSLTEVNILTGKETTGEALAIVDQPTALARTNKALELGLFPNPNDARQIEALAIVALAYGLDPMMGELIPYQGKPYITVQGRRRKDAEAKHHGKISFRLLTEAELEFYREAGAYNKGDVACFCVIEDVDSGASVEGFGRVLGSEGGNSAHLPQATRKIEMMQKRGEMRARAMLWGPIARPQGIEGIQVAIEGDEADVIEGTARVVEDPPQTAPQSLPNYGECSFHPGQMFKTIEAKHGLLVSHPKGKDEEGKTLWCHYHKVLQAQFLQAWEATHEGQRNQNEINDWLKKECGDTWSKLSIKQMQGAPDRIGEKVVRSDVDTNTGEMLEVPETNAQDEIDEAEYQQFITESASAQPEGE